jgi:hypothetical protein
MISIFEAIPSQRAWELVGWRPVHSASRDANNLCIRFTGDFYKSRAWRISIPIESFDGTGSLSGFLHPRFDVFPNLSQ